MMALNEIDDENQINMPGIIFWTVIGFVNSIYGSISFIMVIMEFK